MRISFDLDDTLVCDDRVPAEQVVAWWLRWRYPERLRAGTSELLRTLIRDGHEVWIYTTSYRSPRYLRGWFRCVGVRLGGVVNQTEHDRVVGTRGPSKRPPAFGITLHVDDSTGVAEEGRRFGFDVVVLRPDDPDWTEAVRHAVGRHNQRAS